ncbi:1-phosphofructokinase [Spiroplasma eriocheiris]|uniref:1-phosphofructokinase n=1 Tax=Spiroplasma eriocheiris TaxID=315358 RepID=A0A0H3XI07_9MOLU|nr:1-phosphofructokinase [Spiroplasma eriocheiris]AHF57612.1 1-phosphofructokinase [Spiroplasma eriocheiris CCTCC M 207170]AKM54065.1 1-phosphofructokinase [Spiroplasma eriocheiris]
MIYTLTLNPAIDRIVETETFNLGITNKVLNEYEVLGGKGINVSVMLKNLGCETAVLGWMGQDSKLEFLKYLTAKNINSNFVEVSGKVRVNLKIKNLTTKQETELNGLGFQVSQPDVTKIIEVVKTNVKANDCLIISGSVPQGCPRDLYAMIAKHCAENNIMFVVDSTKEILLLTLSYHPFLIKPNLEELNELFQTNYQFKEEKNIINLGQRLITMGAQNVLISNGKEGSILVTDKNIYQVNSAHGQLVNSVGAGDSMVAGFIGTYLKHHAFDQALVYSASAGAATAFTKGIAENTEVKKLLGQIKINVIK